MNVQKSKTYNISITDYKEHLGISQSVTRYDEKIRATVLDIIAEIEMQCSADIVPSIVDLEDYNFCGSRYRILAGNISITSISATTNILVSPIVSAIGADQYIIQKGQQYTDIVFKSYITADQLNIRYTSGFSEIPHGLNRAIKLKLGYYFDQNEDNTLTNTVFESKAFDRIISGYKNYLI